MIADNSIGQSAVPVKSAPDQGWDIKLEELSVGYGEKTVLSEVNAYIPAGRVNFFLGESGCGKSTLLRHIIGLSRPQKGRIVVGGHDLFKLSGREFRRLRRRMGVLFQDGALLGALTLAENISLPLTEHTKLERKTLRAAVMRALELVGLADFAEYFPNQLSGGMRKRAGLARAIITEPPILLCDEPTSGLDPITAARMDQLLLDMRGHYPDMTIIVVSHDLASLNAIADHVLVLGQGTALFAGEAEELKRSDDPYLRRFLTRSIEASAVGTAAPPNPDVRAALREWLDS